MITDTLGLSNYLLHLDYIDRQIILEQQERIRRMEYETPSGRFPQKRISMVTSPQPTPNIILPHFVEGEVE